MAVGSTDTTVCLSVSLPVWGRKRKKRSETGGGGEREKRREEKGRNDREENGKQVIRGKREEWKG